MKYTSEHPPLQCFMRQSTWYKNASDVRARGVLWHSTGANNPTIKRYVQPDDKAPDRAELLNIIGVNKNGNDWNHVVREAGVHAWIGKLADGSVSTVQTGPWDKKAWGCGSGKKGSCNNGWIQFEICEDDLTDRAYFEAVYREGVELTAYLCQLYGLDPQGTVKNNGVTVPVILCHQDSYRLGLGGNHADVYPWFNRYGKTMDDVRADVARLMKGDDDMDKATFTAWWNEAMANYRKELGAKPPASWAVPYIDECIGNGIMSEKSGSIDRPADFLTRQEGAVMMANTLKAAKK